MDTSNWIFSLIFMCQLSMGQTTSPNTENAASMTVPSNPLVTFSGDTVTTADEWAARRRPELVSFFETRVYGKVPGQLDGIAFETIEENDSAVGGMATRRQVEVSLKKNGEVHRFTLLLYLPHSGGKAPVFLGYNFYGNHTVRADDEIRISGAWSLDNEALGIRDHTLTAASRGAKEGNWPIAEMLAGGYGVATVFYGEVDPDKEDLSDGVQSLFYKGSQTKPADDEWGSLAAWAWGLSRAMDYLVQDARVDAGKIIVFGHSRLGKAALWAGALDERFAAVISNNSGCGGAALSKRKAGERVSDINKNFPHWFCQNFKAYNDREEALEADQHELLALIAPRPVYIASAKEDAWADPEGEFLSAFHASPVYRLYNKTGISSMEMPDLNSPIQNTVAYHIRTGKHDITGYDWGQYLRWAETQLNRGQ